MAGDAHVDDAHLKGLSKIFNGESIRGRANVSDWTSVLLCVCIYIANFHLYLQVAKATYAGVALVALWFTLKPKSKK